MFLSRAALLHDTVLCGLCRREAFAFDQARSYDWYDGTLRQVIRQFKYNKMRPLAKPLAARLAQVLIRMDAGSLDLVLPVPLHRNRQRARGFNQSELLTRQLAVMCDLPLGSRDCVRVRDTPPQTGLRGTERRRNVRGAFAVPRPERVRGLNVLLVDDVITTGATADSCARALKQAGAKGVWVLTLARPRAAWLDVL
jgi:ComF family protein